MNSKFFLECTHILGWPEVSDNYCFCKSNVYLFSMSKTVSCVIIKTMGIVLSLSVYPWNDS